MKVPHSTSSLIKTLPRYWRNRFPLRGWRNNSPSRYFTNYTPLNTPQAKILDVRMQPPQVRRMWIDLNVAIPTSSAPTTMTISMTQRIASNYKMRQSDSSGKEGQIIFFHKRGPMSITPKASVITTVETSQSYAATWQRGGYGRLAPCWNSEHVDQGAICAGRILQGGEEAECQRNHQLF